MISLTCGNETGVIITQGRLLKSVCLFIMHELSKIRKYGMVRFVTAFRHGSIYRILIQIQKLVGLYNLVIHCLNDK